MNCLPEKLFKLRKHYKFSQEYLASVLGVDIIRYMAIENGREIPTYEEMCKLANLYKVNVREIFVNSPTVTLYEVDDTTTDQINIEFFMKRNRWYRRLYRYIKRNRTIQYLLIIFILSTLLTIGLIIRHTNKPLVFEFDETDKLSVNDSSVAYIGLDGNLVVTGQMKDVCAAKVLKVETGNSFIVVLRDDGKVELFGSNIENRTAVSKLKNIVNIEAADDHIIAIDKYGEIYTIGGNNLSEVTISSWKNIKSIDTFSNCTIGIDEEGYLVFAGEPVGKSQFKRYRNPIDYDANENITVVVKSDGTVDYSAYNDHYANVTGWKDIVEIACGSDFIAGLKSDGTVLISSIDDEMCEEVKNWKNISCIDAGSDYLIAFDGTNIYGAGKNKYEQFIKEEKIKEKISMIDGNSLKVTIGEEYVSIEFEKVENAYGYRVSLNGGTAVSYEIRENEKAKFPVKELENHAYYTVSIISLANEGYDNSDVFEYVFEYVKPETKEEKKETEFPVYHLIGKTKTEFETYLEQYGVNKESIVSIEDEVLCDSDDVLVTYVEGYEDGEVITSSELIKREIKYKYCRLENGTE